MHDAAPMERSARKCPESWRCGSAASGLGRIEQKAAPAADLDPHAMLAAIDGIVAQAQSRMTPESQLIDSAAFWIRRQIAYSGDPVELNLILEFMTESLPPAAPCIFASHTTNREFLNDFENYVRQRVLEGDRVDFASLRKHEHVSQIAATD